MESGKGKGRFGMEYGGRERGKRREIGEVEEERDKGRGRKGKGKGSGDRV